MRVTRLDTLRLDEFPNLLFLEVHTDDGLVGLGETFFGARAVEAYIHESVAPYLLGDEALDIERHAREMRGYLGRGGSGVETRGNSAVDIALWDLYGKATGLPLYRLLGGKSRDEIQAYNTCAGYRYVRETPRQEVGNWGISAERPDGPYEDLEAFLHRADELAEDLLSQGISGMKIWPFDPFAEVSGGHYISRGDLELALEPFRKIRAAVGPEMDVMVELHSLWDLPTAKRIARALEPFEPYWLEDPVRAEDSQALAELAASTDVPIAAGETLAGQAAFRRLMDAGVDVVILDVSWCGGLTEARKIASEAGTRKLPVAPHDCTGPVVLSASAHLSINLPNAVFQETVRAYYTGWYKELVSGLPVIKNGKVRPAEGAGHCVELLPEVRERPDLHLTTSEL